MSSSETLECPPPEHWCVSQEDTAVSFCRTRGFKFSPRTPRKRALRDTEMVTKIRFALFDHNSSTNSLLFISRVPPQTPCRRHLLKKQKHYGIYVVDLSNGNLPNPSVSGELRASRLPRLPWLKTPRQNLTSQTIIKRRANRNFLSFIANGDSPPGCSGVRKLPVKIKKR